MGLIRRIENGTTTESDASLVKRIFYFLFAVGIVVGLLILGSGFIFFIR